jgi:AraC-like DNA-binding protein
MDMLSDAIIAMRAGQPHSARTERLGTWTARHAPFPGAGFHVVLQGTCRFIPANSDPLALGPGDIVLLPHGDAHGLSDIATRKQIKGPATALSTLQDQSTTSESGAATVLLCGGYLLDQHRPHPLMAELPEIIHLPARVGHHPSLRSTIDLLGAELHQRHHGTNVIVPALLDALLVYVLRAWLDEQPTHHRATGWAAALQDPQVSTALSRIHTNPARSWTVAELGAEAGLSRAAFAHRFTTVVGRPPLTYLTWWRMTVAARLLRDSDAPLATVAKQTGYTSEFALANAFKREFGISPGHYRKQRHTDQGPARPPRLRTDAD